MKGSRHKIIHNAKAHAHKLQKQAMLSGGLRSNGRYFGERLKKGMECFWVPFLIWVLDSYVLLCETYQAVHLCMACIFFYCMLYFNKILKIE